MSSKSESNGNPRRIFHPTVGEFAVSSKKLTKKERQWHIETVISIIALLASLVSLYFSVIGTPGTIQPIKPTGYSIIRGDGSFPSDSIVLPFEWENTSGKPIVIRQPVLILNELDSNGKKYGNEFRFILAGEYPEISSEAFNKQYALKNSFVVEAHSIPLKVLMFHYEKFWDETDKFYKFQFKGKQRFSVSVEFQPNLEQRRKIDNLFQLPIYLRVDELQHDRSKPWWDFFYFE